jgi:hypothetical protein
VKLVFRGAIGVSACLLFVGAATGCGSSTDTASTPTPTITVTESESSQSPSSNNSGEPACTAEALEEGLNGDPGPIKRFDCARTESTPNMPATYWAAAEFDNKSTMLWSARDGEWYERNEVKLCKEQVNLPSELRDYCLK